MKTNEALLSRKELHKRIPYSITHIGRLERAGRFPKRIRLGPCRVGWLATEVDAWIAQRVEERDDAGV